MDGSIVLRIVRNGHVWEMVVPDYDVAVPGVRVFLRDFQTRGAIEASATIAWPEYRSVRDWLRCLPDGYCSTADLESAIGRIMLAFAPLVSVLGLDLASSWVPTSPEGT
jgi:hypothetical protein